MSQANSRIKIYKNYELYHLFIAQISIIIEMPKGQKKRKLKYLHKINKKK